MLALICHQANVYEEKNNNPPPGFTKWEIDMKGQNRMVELGEKIRREPWKLRWDVHLTNNNSVV